MCKVARIAPENPPQTPVSLCSSSTMKVCSIESGQISQTVGPVLESSQDGRLLTEETQTLQSSSERSNLERFYGPAPMDVDQSIPEQIEGIVNLCEEEENKLIDKKQVRIDLAPWKRIYSNQAEWRSMKRQEGKNQGKEPSWDKEGR